MNRINKDPVPVPRPERRLVSSASVANLNKRKSTTQLSTKVTDRRAEPSPASLIQPGPVQSSTIGRTPLRKIKKFSSVSNLDAARIASESQLPAPSLEPIAPPAFNNPQYGELKVTTGSSRLHQRTKSTSSGLSPKARKIERDAIDALLKRPPQFSLSNSLQELRYLVLTEGIKMDKDGNSPIRAYVWSIFLNVPPMKTNDYLSLVRRGPSPAYAKIRNDTFRTLATDLLFRRNVSEASLIRLLNAHAWTLKDEGNDALYVQGMNVISAPFLYASRSEVEAFSMFSTFVRRECPGYVRPTLDGVHKGLKLVDQVLETADPVLYEHLKSKYLSAELYAFPSVLTLSACTPPLNEVLPLWDFLLAYGAHMNILCVVAQLLLMRDKLLEAQSPMKLLRQFPALRSKEIISVAVSLVKRIPNALYERLITHAQ